MQQRRFIQCDVFTPNPTKGNALAVVVDAEGLSAEQMQAFAAWTNLAETTFLRPADSPEADYQVSIYTPTREMLFAGHPTLGSCAAWLHSGGTPGQAGLVRQECGVGIVEIDISGAVPAFIAPPTQIDELPAADFHAITNQLKLDKQSIVRSALLNNGPVWSVFELDSADAVLAVDSALVKWPQFKSIGLMGKYPAGAECDYEVRMLAPSSGMSEDPITGSLNSALAHWKLSLGQLTQPTLVSQGKCIDRHGRVFVRPDKQVPGKVYIGGETHILIEGTVLL